MRSPYIIQAAVLSTLLFACAAEPAPPPPSGQARATAETSSKTEPSKAREKGGEEEHETGAPAQSACPDLPGRWTGTVAGVAKVTASSMTEKVKGTSTVTLVSEEDGGDVAVGKGSVFEITIATVLGDVPWTQAVSGTVRGCVLDASVTTTIGGKTIGGGATCTLDATGCSGEWHAEESGTPVAKGTFELARR